MKIVLKNCLQRLLMGAMIAPGFIMAEPKHGYAQATQTATVCSRQGSEFDFNGTYRGNSVLPPGADVTSGMRAKLENPDYFGPGGAAAPESIVFSTLPVVTAATLAPCDIFIGGGFQENLSSAEGNALATWVNNQSTGRRAVIGGCDSGNNRTCEALGRNLTQFNSGLGVTLTQSLAFNPLNCGGAGTVQTFGGAASRIDTLGTDSILATHNGGGSGFTGSAAAVTDSLLNPTLIMTADADMYGSAGNPAITDNPTADNDQAIFILNIFKFTLDGLAARLDNPQCFADYNTRTDLAIDISAAPTIVEVGDTLTVTLSTTNESATTTSLILANSEIPAGFSFVSQSGDGTYNPATGNWDIGTLSGNEVATIELVLQADGLGTPEMRAEIIRANLPDFDSAPNATFGVDDFLDGFADDDEDSLVLTVALQDFGDAPGFDATLPEGPASHFLTNGLFLGTAPTADVGPQTANGDASDDANDDGITIPALEAGASVTFTASVTENGFLQGWVDWNGNGVFDAIEQIATDLQDTDGDGVILIPTFVPANATTSATFARFRWSSAFGIGVGGQVADGEVEDYQVTIGGQATISGQIIVDNGATGTSAHNGSLDAEEIGGAFATIQIFDDNTNALIATTTVDATGNWTAAIPDGSFTSLRVEAVPLPGYRIISESGGTISGLVNPNTTDGVLTFPYSAGSSQSGLVIGVIEEPRLTQDQDIPISAGQVVNLPHLYTATSSGTVSFSITNQVPDTPGLFSSTLFQDTDCDGIADELIPASIAVNAGDEICVIVRTQAAAGIAPTASYSYNVVATTSFSRTTASSVIENTDRLNASRQEVVLRKLVTNVTQATPEGTSNSGDIGDVLRYRIVVSNPGATSAADIEIFDQTPAYTALAAALPASVPLGPNITCNLAQPSAGTNLSGYTGALQWICPGSFGAGQTGDVTFDVQISP